MYIPYFEQSVSKNIVVQFCCVNMTCLCCKLNPVNLLSKKTTTGHQTTINNQKSNETMGETEICFSVLFSQLFYQLVYVSHYCRRIIVSEIHICMQDSWLKLNFSYTQENMLHALSVAHNKCQTQHHDCPTIEPKQQNTTTTTTKLPS